MPLPSSGPISLSQVNTELGLSATATISLNDNAVRTLAGVPSGAISMNNLYGKSNQFAFTISSNQTNADLRTLAINAGWNQSSRLVATIAGGVIISSNNSGAPALTVSGSFPGGVELTNNGVIVGMGGAGGQGGNAYGVGPPYVPGSTAGSSGGTALSVSAAASINNASGTIAGGGGGGGGGADYSTKANGTGGGGGGGGGRSSAAANSAGGLGGWGVGSPFNYPFGNPGGAGTYSSAGAGGARVGNYGALAGAGGNGGGWGSAGAGGGNASPYNNNPPRPGGSGGASVSGNSNITWLATGTRIGAIT